MGGINLTTILLSNLKDSSPAMIGIIGKALARMADLSLSEDWSVQGSLSRTALTTSCRFVDGPVAMQEESSCCSKLSLVRLEVTRRCGGGGGGGGGEVRLEQMCLGRSVQGEEEVDRVEERCLQPGEIHPGLLDATVLDAVVVS